MAQYLAPCVLPETLCIRVGVLAKRVEAGAWLQHSH